MSGPSSGWDYTDATLTAVKLTSGDFGGQGAFSPPALYEFTYIAKDPIVVGLGFASLRDLAVFLRQAKTDDNGVANRSQEMSNIYTRFALLNPAEQPAISCCSASIKPNLPVIGISPKGNQYSTEY